MNLFESIFRENSLDRTALIFASRQITYRELQAETLRFLRTLADKKVREGDRVAILLDDSPEFLAAFIAIIASGAIAVPINPGLQVNEKLAILKDCGARLLILEVVEVGNLFAKESSASESLEIIVINRAQESLKRDGIFALGPTVQSLKSLQDAPPARFTPSSPDEPALILYTSGSTGEPKGAVHSQSDIFYTNDTFCREVLNVHDGDRFFSSSRLPFAYGLGNSLSFPLLNGATTILCSEKPTPSVIGEIFSRLKPTIFFGVPVVYRLLLDHHLHVEPLDCASLRLCISAGEALPAQLGEEWHSTIGIEILDGIGSTEMLHMFISNHEGGVKYGSSGQLLDGYEARLLAEDGGETAIGVEGNLWIKGASAAKGYWQRPELTAQTFVDGWVRTGDLYRCDEDGYWFHMGRSDDCFKSSGQWVSPVEVEGVLLRHGSVNRVAVVEDFDAARLPCAAAFIVSEGDVSSEELEAELIELVKTALSRFKRPQRYFFVSDLPYTATGKVQRFKLRKSLREESNQDY